MQAEAKDDLERFFKFWKFLVVNLCISSTFSNCDQASERCRDGTAIGEIGTPSGPAQSFAIQVSSHFDHWHRLPVPQMDAMLQGVQQAVVKRVQLNQRLSGDLTVLQENLGSSCGDLPCWMQLVMQQLSD